MPTEAVIFDLDGTLADTLDDLTDAYNYGLDILNQPRQTPEDFRLMIGTGSLDLCRLALPPDRDDLAEELLRLSLAYYIDHQLDNTVPYPGVTELLDQLAQRGIRQAVLSNKPQSYVKEICRGLFGPDPFELIVGQIDGVPLKPDPTAVLAIVKKMKADPAAILYVGDSGTDMATAVNAKLTAVGVTWGFRDRPELQATGADHIIDHPRELLALL